MRLTIESSFDSRILRNSSDMQLKKSSITESPVEVLLEGRLINDEGIVLEDGEIGSLFQKLCIDDQQEEEPTNLSGCPQKFDESEENYDESLLNPKGPVKNKPPREQPYEQRLFNKSLMNGGGMVQNFCYYPQIPLHGMIPIPVQKFQSQSASKNIALEEPGYHPYSQYMGPLERMNIPLVTNNDWNGTYQPLQITSNRVDSPLSSDSGINSPSSSPNGRHNQQAWSYDQPPMLGLGVATQVPMSEVQADSPCSPDSGHSPKGSPDSSWLNNSMSPNHGYYSNSPSTLNLSSPKVPNTPLNWDQNLYRGSVEYSMSTINVPEHNWSMPPESFTQFSHHPTNYKGDGGCTTGFPEANIDLGQMDPMQWRDLEKFVREVLDSPQDAIGEAAPVAPAVEQESSAARPFTLVPPPETFAPDVTPSPTPDESKPKSKGRSKTKARQEKAPQQKRKPSKTISLGSDRPKICDMIDSKKESTKAIWMGISLMPEETFCRKNKIGQTCLMEVLQGDKLSIERAFYIVQRMKKDGKLLTAKDESGKNALYLAALRPHIPLAEFIAASYASAGLDVNEPFFAEENSLIHCLVEEGDTHAEVLRELLDVKVDNGRLFDSNATNINGDTPLHLALRNLSKKSPPFDLTAVDTLLKRGASISIKNSEGDTPLHLAAKVACEEKVFQKLFERLSLPPEENPCAMNIQDNNGNTPLHLVAYQINPCNVEKMKKVINVFLSEKNTRTDVENNRNTTPEGNIHQSCAKDCFELFHKRKL